MKKTLRLLTTLACLAATAAFAADPLRIGVLLPTTGVFAPIGAEQLNGMQVAVEEAGGAVAGRQIDDDLEFHGPARPVEVAVAHREPVHHRPVPGGRIDVGDDGRGERATNGIEQPLPARRQRGRGPFHERDRGFEVDHAAAVPVCRNARSRS